MRLRQLRTTQSITFFAPPEVDRSIKDLCPTAAGERLDSSHVVLWLLEQTCCANEHLQSLYVAQGLDFCRRTDAAWRHPDFLIHTAHRTKLLDILQQPERQTLEQLYGGALVGSSKGAGLRVAPQLQTFADRLAQSSGRRDVEAGALEEVEQEREVQVQVEQVRQVQKPLQYDALRFPGLHQALVHFVNTGVLNTALVGQGMAGFEHAFACVARTSVGKQFGVRSTGSRLFVSEEFGRTVKWGKDGEVADNFLVSVSSSYILLMVWNRSILTTMAPQRPVEWILWSPSAQTAVVIIPEEAELLIAAFRLLADPPPVHLIAYAAPVTKAMLSFNRFQYYSLPSLPTAHSFPEWFRIELGILAGRLYVDMAEWDSLASYLQSPSEVTECLGKDDVRPEQTHGVDLGPGKFADDPAAFLLEWITVRRKAQDVLHTPIGYICTGRTLGENHPFREYVS
jgi:hypothetical protein